MFILGHIKMVIIVIEVEDDGKGIKIKLNKKLLKEVPSLMMEQLCLTKTFKPYLKSFISWKIYLIYWKRRWLRRSKN